MKGAGSWELINPAVRGDDGSPVALVSMGAGPWELRLPWKIALIISIVITNKYL